MLRSAVDNISVAIQAICIHTIHDIQIYQGKLINKQAPNKCYIAPYWLEINFDLDDNEQETNGTPHLDINNSTLHDSLEESVSLTKY
jgi:hypothetical protein